MKLNEIIEKLSQLRNGGTSGDSEVVIEGFGRDIVIVAIYEGVLADENDIRKPCTVIECK